MLKQASKIVLLNSLWTVLGRVNLIRLGRFLLNEGRLDTGNGLDRNGEGLIQACVAEHWKGTPKVTMLDIGANVGIWSFEMGTHLRSRGTPFRVFAFEPCTETWHTLSSNLTNWELNSAITAVNCAVSTEIGEVCFYSLGADQGRNSLYPHPNEVDQKQIIPSTSIDDWCRQERVETLHYVKIDTEGHDLEVLRGAERMLREQRIEMLQFEYNHRWIEPGFFLRDAFELVQSHGYALGKITRLGVEFYDAWNFELESFQEGNYLAVKPANMTAFPTVKYWKEG